MRVNSKTKVHVGGTLKQSAGRLLDGVARYERGETVREKHLSFPELAGAVQRADAEAV